MGVPLAATRRLVAAFVLLPLAASADDTGPSRTDLERFEWALDRAVRKVSRPSAAPILGGAEACRGYHITGYGALFVLAPRSLPTRQRSARESPPQVGADPPPALRARLERLEAQRRRVRDGSRASEREQLLALEAQVAALQRAAETAREEAELALEETTRELHRRLISPTLGVPAPAVPAAAPPLPAVSGEPVSTPPVPPTPAQPAQPAQIPPPPLPPWRFWFDSEEPEEPRSPERVVLDVRSAVTDVLESQGPPLSLGPEEFVAVVVDFLPSSAFATRTRPARTLVVRVRKRELEERAAGRLASEDLRKRIEYSEY
jgi:hypothetical protein